MTLLALQDLTVSIGSARPVDGVTLSVTAGEMLGIVGESGSGKSLTLKAVLRLLPSTAQLTGQVLWQGRDLVALREPAMRQVRGRDIAIGRAPACASQRCAPPRWRHDSAAAGR
jgi:peptide/nickel transport system ATP-binding protein